MTARIAVRGVITACGETVGASFSHGWSRIRFRNFLTENSRGTWQRAVANLIIIDFLSDPIWSKSTARPCESHVTQGRVSSESASPGHATNISTLPGYADFDSRDANCRHSGPKAQAPEVRSPENSLTRQYTDFTTNDALVGPKPTHTLALSYNNSDHAGTPKVPIPATAWPFKQFVVGGARGGGGSDWTGSWSRTAGVSVCLPPVGLPE